MTGKEFALLTFVNCYNVRLATRFNDTFTITKVAALVCIIVAGIAWLFLGHTDYFEMPDVVHGSQTEVSTLTLAFYAGVFSFSGFSYLNFVTEELKDPYRNLPRAIYISLSLVTLVYMLVNVAYFAVLSVDEILESDAVAVTFAEKVMGPAAPLMPFFILESDAVAVTFAKKVMGPAAPLMPFFVACSCFGSLNGILFTSSRMFFAGAREGQLPELLSMISVNYLTPLPSLLFLGAASIVMLFAGDVLVLINYCAFAESLVVAVSVAGLIRLRFSQPQAKTPIRVNIFIPLLFLFFCCLFLILPFFSQPKELIVGVGMILTGIPVYFLFVRTTKKPSVIYVPWVWFTHWIQKILYCVPESEELA
ncbi:unnamed protein product [Nippostrongylus brasiliensis]|uniref:Cystine/glutamate transporter (inferred by orthology to a human protein) n=1 Tax=Nippostrongylus brasiliensis TaxID=27835 RepID=A0A0N4YA10_NIPBR|nr:unnamed protein product [Nippostrongylus brasiliensis]